MHRLILVSAMAIVGCSGAADRPQPGDTGGPLIAEQAAFDVLHYDLTLRVDPDRREIDGELSMRAHADDDLDVVVLDLEPNLEVTGIRQGPAGGGTALDWSRRAGRLWVELSETVPAGDTFEVAVAYSGRPRVAPNPPWEGGFTWASAADGLPWVGVSCQVDGADAWWPCKDHPSDEPDEGVDLHITVPEPLRCVSNGRLVAEEDAGDGETTFHWRVSTPINTYDVTINIGPFQPVSLETASVTGEVLPVTWWALPESADRAERLLDEFVDQLRFLEEELGPYPFRADKCGVVDTPYLAMEHQTAIAIGEGGDAVRGGYSFIVLHELTHEWWGNLVSASDWRDFWLHEGFTGYMEARYAERLGGIGAYHDYMRQAFRGAILNRAAVAPREPRSLRQIFVTLDAGPGEFGTRDVDAYVKGAWVLHTLRYLVGEEIFHDVLRRWAYPDPELEAVTDGRQCRLVTTEGFQRLVESLSGRDLDWFFELYLRQPELPRLRTELRGGELVLRWRTPAGLEFPMPVELRRGGESFRVEMPDGKAVVPWPPGVDPIVDPDGWILREGV
jgi:aminopeptidase N